MTSVAQGDRAAARTDSAHRRHEAKPAEDIAIRGLKFQATTTPLKPGGFGGYVRHPVRVELARPCTLEGLGVAAVSAARA